ncbi:MAG: heat-shock protein [Candidatus Pelagibacter sp.]|nr:heat-shock protein [Candidatus Pelagibacter sp.]OUV98519.1 MAG: heat-shock protein [Candidatus Pelagibacter sp. TMED142]
MNKNALSIFNQLRPVSVGFDNMFDHFEKMFEDDYFDTPTVNYPPYNIVKTGENKYDVEVALAGYNKKDINIEYADNLLTIKSLNNKSLKKDTDNGVLHKGISKRFFSKTFTIADDTEVKSAVLKDGLLKVSLERIIPEVKKPKIIEIQ